MEAKRCGVEAVLGIPLRVEGATIGAMNVEAAAIAAHRRFGFRTARAEVPDFVRQTRARGPTDLRKGDELG